MEEPVALAALASWVDGQVALESWLQVSRALVEDLPLSGILDVIAGVARHLSGNLFAMVALVDEHGERLVVKGAAGLPEEYLAVTNDKAPLLVNPPHGRAETPSVRAFRTGKPVILRNVFADDIYAEYVAAAHRQGYVAILSMPLAGPGELGVLTVYASTPDAFEQSQIDLLSALAKGAAAAIEIARLRERELIMRAELQEVDRMHQRLTRIALADQGLAPIVRSLSDMTGYAMRLEDDVADAALAAWPADHRGPVLSAAVRSRMKGQATKTRAVVTRRSSAKDGPVYLAPIVIGGDVVAHLWANGSRQPMATAQERVFERGAMVIALELLKQRHTDEVDWRMRGDLFRDLLSFEPGDAPEMLHRARSYGLDLTRPHAVLVTRPDPDPSGTATSDVPVERVISCVRRMVAQSHVRGLIGSRDGAVLLLWPVTGEADRSPAHVARSIRASVTALSGGSTVSVAIGDTCESPLDYRIATQLAAGALRVTQEAGTRNRVVDVEDLAIYRLLLSVQDPTLLRGFSDRILGPLRQQHETRNADLVRTLRVYLENDLQSNRTAVALHVHPNTLAYRLRRIETLTGSSLRSSKGLLEMSFAVAVDRLLSG
jgi:sugar diacid utilization regulator